MNNRPCVVVVEDEPSLLELMRDALRLEGYEVVGVSRPSLVLDTLQSVHPELFLIDVMLPGMSGIELAEQLRAAGQTAPIITMSASKLMTQVATQSGAVDDSIDKPFDVFALIRSLHSYLEPRPANHTQEQIS